MSSIRIRDLPDKIDNLDDEDLLVVEDAEDTKKITLIRLRAIFSMDGILTSMKNSLLEKINSFMENHSSKYKELLYRNTDLEVLCHNLQNDHDHDAERIFELEDKLVIQEEISATLLSERNKLLQLLKTLQNDKDALSDEIVKLNKQLSDNESAIVVLKSQVKDLQLKSSELKQINKELQDYIDKVEQEADGKIDSNFMEVNEYLKKVDEDLMKYIRYYHPDVDNITI